MGSKVSCGKGTVQLDKKCVAPIVRELSCGPDTMEKDGVCTVPKRKHDLSICAMQGTDAIKLIEAGVGNNVRVAPYNYDCVGLWYLDTQCKMNIKGTCAQHAEAMECVKNCGLTASSGNV